MSKDKLVPELRFPEFKNEGEWIVNELNDFCFNISSGKDKNSDVGKYELYGSTGIIRTDIASYNGDYILVARVGANAGLLNRAKGKFGVTDNTLVLDLKKVDIIDFIQYSLYKIGLNKLVFGSGQPLITGGQLKCLQLATSKNEEEQQKIASCLSSLDEVIAAHIQKLEVLKDHKKGLMQNLFPQEGEKVPMYRFKEFENDGVWVEKSLGSICEVITKGTTPQNFSKDGIRFIKIEAFQENQIIQERCMFIDEDTHNKELKRSILKENDILFAIAGATIGKVNIVKKEILPANTNQALAILRLKEKENNNFILQILKSQIMQVFVQKSISVGAQPNLNLEQMGSFSFAYPKNPKEQQKIASCLSSLDTLITAQTEKIEQLQLHKKGLMQGLFPKIND